MSNGGGKGNSKELEKQKKLEEKRRNDFLKWQKLWEVVQKDFVVSENACIELSDGMTDLVKLMKNFLDKVRETDDSYTKKMAKIRDEIERLEKLKEKLGNSLEALRKLLKNEESKTKKDEKRLNDLEKDETNLEKQIELLKKQIESQISKYKSLDKERLKRVSELRKVGMEQAKHYRSDSKKLDAELKKHQLLSKKLEVLLKQFNTEKFFKDYPEQGNLLESQIKEGASGPFSKILKNLEKVHENFEEYLDLLTPSITKTM